MVLATAGSPDKRTHLRNQGVRNVLSSRDLRFAEHLGCAGQGRPSIVLNSLTSPGVPCNGADMSQRLLPVIASTILGQTACWDSTIHDLTEESCERLYGCNNFSCTWQKA